MKNESIAEVRALADLISKSRSLVVFTGAGMSTESGIPDYRSPGGLWTKRQAPLYQDFISSAHARRDYWLFYQEFFPAFVQARPHTGHLALGSLFARGRLTSVITQNIDGLHAAGGVDPEYVLELHGNVFRTGCVECGRHQEKTASVLSRFLEGEHDPGCPLCGSPLKPQTISFGQSLDQEVLQKAADYCSKADLLLVVGSSLVVTPAASLPRLTLATGGKLAILNKQPTPLDDDAALVLRGQAGALLHAALDLIE
ncbi:MAG: Sir2 family NAD-dependent protein deacetylase [Desulfarculaceae bacterium]|jgi:NAD-dependent deacetylase